MIDKPKPFEDDYDHPVERIGNFRVGQEVRALGRTRTDGTKIIFTIESFSPESKSAQLRIANDFEAETITASVEELEAV